jgi:hypothetical protein
MLFESHGSLFQPRSFFLRRLESQLSPSYVYVAKACVCNDLLGWPDCCDKADRLGQAHRADPGKGQRTVLLIPVLCLMQGRGEGSPGAGSRVDMKVSERPARAGRATISKPSASLYHGPLWL